MLFNNFIEKIWKKNLESIYKLVLMKTVRIQLTSNDLITNEIKNAITKKEISMWS